jgi:hypothetical protein
MTKPSDYELAAWQDLQRFRGRPVLRIFENAGEQVAASTAKLNTHASAYLEKHPKAQATFSQGRELVAHGARAVGAGKQRVTEVFPDWSHTAVASVKQMGAQISRVGLTPNGVVKKHKKCGHDVESLYDVRRLDLQKVDVVRGRGTLSWYYPLTAAASGGVSAFVISGGEFATAVSAGAAAAPSGATIAGALAADAAAVLGLASRSVGHVALLYGYDPEEPGEKMFVMSVINAGTAMSAGAKTAALADISRLTQALYRGKSWAVLLDTSIVARVSKRVAEKFIDRLTKKGLGKLVPGAGIAIGAGMNFASLAGIVDAAEYAYRRRFLLEKYPHLAVEEATVSFPDTVSDADDVTISVIAELEQEGGPEVQ